MSKLKKSPPAAVQTLTVSKDPGKTTERQVADMTLSPVVRAAATAHLFSQTVFGPDGVPKLEEAVSVIVDSVKKVNRGDMSSVEATLTAQAAALDVLFHELVRRSGANMGEYMQAAEMYMRLALKAQSQCANTLRTLAEVKNPRTPTFIRQANVANGPQVNNQADVTLLAGESAFSSNELKGNPDGSGLERRRTQSGSGLIPSLASGDC